MTRYFFDFRTGGALCRDEEGVDRANAGKVHDEAVAALVDAISDAALEGQSEYRFAIEVRDEWGPVLQVSAVLDSKILRKQ